MSQSGKKQPLFISANYERVDFVRIVANEAYKIGVKDIYFDLTDSILKHDALKNLDVEDLKKFNSGIKKSGVNMLKRVQLLLCLLLKHLVL